MQKYGKGKTARHNSPKTERRCRTCKGIMKSDKPLKGRARAANKELSKETAEEENERLRQLLRKTMDLIGEDSLGQEEFYDLYNEIEEEVGQT